MRRAALVAAAILLSGCASSRPSGLKPFRAGAFAMDVTPEKLPISVNGGMSDRQATSSHDTLRARCLVLDDGDVKVGIAVVDSCMIPRELLDEAKALASRATGIPSDHLLISATHTHTAPSVAGVFQSDPDEGYRKYLARRIAEGIATADRRLEPAQIGWAVGKEPGQVFNRRWLLKPGKLLVDPFGREKDRVKMNPGYNNPDVDRPAGPTDPEVPVVAVRSVDGRPIAALVNYSLHYVGGHPALSADYFGAFAARFAELAGTGPDFVALLSNGTSGDINNVDYSQKQAPKRQPGEQIDRVAGDVARAAFEAWKAIEWHSSEPLAMREAELELGVRRPSPEELTRAREILAAAGGKELKGLDQVYARETTLIADYPATVRLKLQAIRIGDLGIAAIPCEVFVEIGLAIKKRSPLKPTFTIELANGYNGYLPTPEHHALGGYETWRARSSYLEVDASPKILETVLRLLNDVAR
jgi:hypothetical protein